MKESSLLSRAAAGAAALWNGTARVRVGLYRNGLLPRRRLRGKVISVGNIAWGGTGKTPFTIWLARRLRERGQRVSILIRGYRRASRERIQIIAPRTPPDKASDAGDEVQLYLRNLWGLELPIGVSASRHEAGQRLENQFPTDVHLLDDGFQHVALHRDLDLVLVDAENPWGRRGAFPSFLRESPTALSRADAVLLTRCEFLESEPENSAGTLRAALLQRNPGAEFFAVKTRLLGFRDANNDARVPAEEIRTLRPFAFCGIGNPNAFLGTLERSGIAAVGHKIFPDHHRYRRSELATLAQTATAAGARCLLTTEKDWVNFPPAPPDGAASSSDFQIPVYWAEMDLMIEEESRLLGWISKRLELPAPEEPPTDRLVSESKLGR